MFNTEILSDWLPMIIVLLVPSYLTVKYTYNIIIGKSTTVTLLSPEDVENEEIERLEKKLKYGDN